MTKPSENLIRSLTDSYCSSIELNKKLIDIIAEKCPDMMPTVSELVETTLKGVKDNQ